MLLNTNTTYTQEKAEMSHGNPERLHVGHRFLISRPTHNLSIMIFYESGNLNVFAILCYKHITRCVPALRDCLYLLFSPDDTYFIDEWCILIGRKLGIS